MITKHIENLYDEVKESEIIITDTGIANYNQESFLRNTYGLHTFSKISNNEINIARTEIENIKIWYNFENTFTTNKSYLEIKKYTQLLKHKFEYLNNNYKYQKNSIRVKNNYNVKNGINQNQNKINNFSELILESNKSLSKMKKKILKNNDEINKYFNFILELENELKIKSDSNLKYINYCKKYEIQNTDEELVAHAIYTSQIQNKKTTIVTKDYDLIWLLIATKIFMPKYNEKNLNIYMQDTDRFYLKNTKEAYDEKTQRFINKKGFDQLSKINTKLQYIISELPH